MAGLSQILRTARAGSPARAWAMFVDGGWLEASGDPKALTLKARLIKDQAKASQGAKRLQLFSDAAEAYASASVIAPASYPLINAASLAMLGGKLSRSLELAQQVLRMLDANPNEAETPYWLAATRAEAYLLLGQETEARAALSDAIAKAPMAYEDHAATIGQFRLILAELGADSTWLERHRPPASMHFQGVMQLSDTETAMRQKVDDVLARHNIGFGYGALAAGADILIAEALIESGAELHVVLPCNIETFRKQSVAPYDGHWGKRFDALIEAAESIEFLDTPDKVYSNAVSFCDAACVGMAKRNADILQSAAHILRIDGDISVSDERLSMWQGQVEQVHGLITPNSSETGQKLPQLDDGQSCVFVTIRHGDILADDAAILSRHEGDAGTILQLRNIADAWTLISRLEQDHFMKGEKVLPFSIEAGFQSQDGEKRILLQRAAGLGAIAAGEQLLSGKMTAFALLGTQKHMRIEEAGEMRNAYGAIPAYAIISSNRRGADISQ